MSKKVGVCRGLHDDRLAASLPVFASARPHAARKLRENGIHSAERWRSAVHAATRSGSCDRAAKYSYSYLLMRVVFVSTTKTNASWLADGLLGGLVGPRAARTLAPTRRTAHQRWVAWA